MKCFNKSSMRIYTGIVIILSLFGINTAAYSQTQQSILGWIDFDSPPNNFSVTLGENFNTTPNYGTNMWITNNDYDGQGIYMDTPPQDSTYGGIGQISNPGGNYLHIRDLSSAAQNCNYDPAVATERWTVMSSGICTQGYSKVFLNFWWVGLGSPGDYGEVYYSVTGAAGPWLPTSKLDAAPCGNAERYCGTDKWKFARVEDGNFINKNNLSFAWKWTNDGINSGDQLPFGIDDIIIVGEYDQNMPSSDIIAISMNPDTVCHEETVDNFMEFFFTLTDSLCPGSYAIILSDSNCDFNNSTALSTFGTGTLLPNINYVVSGTILIPTTVPPADCYCFRIDRISPPLITGIPDTGCFTVIDTCSETTSIASTPAVLQDPLYNPTNPANPVGLPVNQQAICLYSVIDVKFLSFGAYNPGNNYVLELSDSSGSFADPEVIGGPMPSTQTHDPAIYPMQSPGSISGTIPDSVNGVLLPEGCNYYIRVVSTNPPGIAEVWGPLCIMHCDVKTNDGEDISVCITDGCRATYTETIPVGITNSIDFTYTTTTVEVFVGLETTDSTYFDQNTCSYVDTTVVDSMFEYDYTIDITSQGLGAMGRTWMVNGDVISPTDTVNPSLYYACQGTYNIQLVPGNGCANIVDKEVALGNLVADFSFTVDSTVVAFSENSQSLPADEATWFWEFGDGWTSSDPNPVHEYSDCFGSWDVTLTMTAKNCCASKKTITVKAGQLLADFSYTVAGSAVSFTDLSVGMYDTDVDKKAWVWDFGDGNLNTIWGGIDTLYDPATCKLDTVNMKHTIYDDGVNPFDLVESLALGDSIKGDIANHSFASCGYYDVSLTVIDSGDVCITVPYQVNSFDQSLFYDTCNQFRVQILSPGDPPMYPPAMTIISEGGLGWRLDTQSGEIELCVPAFTMYQAIGYQLGMYYMRIVSTGQDDVTAPLDTTNLLGSLIRFSVSGISGQALTFSIVDQNGQPADTICAASDNIGLQLLSPQVQTSNYVVEFNHEDQIYGYFLWNPDIHPWPSILFAPFTDWPTGSYFVTIQEVEKGYPGFGSSQDGYCVGPQSGPVYFYLQGPPDVTIEGDRTVCVGDTTTYTSNFNDTVRYCSENSEVMLAPYISSTYFDWTFLDNFNIGTVINLSNNQITIAWTGFGPAQIELSALGSCGSASNSTTILVSPTADLVLSPDPDTVVCEGQMVTLTASNDQWVSYNNFSWMVGCDTVDQDLVTVNSDTYTFEADSDITYTVHVDNDGCPDKDTIKVFVVELPELETFDTEICIGDTVQLDAFAPEATAYLWTPSLGLSDDIISDPRAYPTVTTDYVVTVAYDSICPDLMDTATVTVNSAVADVNNDTTIFRGDEVVLNATGGATYTWTPSTGLSDPNSANPIASPDSTTTYLVVIVDADGCMDSVRITIEVISFLFEPEVPDAFTPNGSGVSENNNLYVFDVGGREGDAVESIVFKIFNRWGELIFEATSRDEIIYPNGGWNGTNMNNGKEMEVGVYVWLLEAQTVKGLKIGPISGNVSLLK